MRLEGDEAKRRHNFTRHGIDFAGLAKVFEGESISILDNRYDYGETRFITVGLLRGRVVAIAHTEGDDIIRVISARRATKNEESAYFKEVRN